MSLLATPKTPEGKQAAARAAQRAPIAPAAAPPAQAQSKPSTGPDFRRSRQFVISGEPVELSPHPNNPARQPNPFVAAPLRADLFENGLNTADNGKLLITKDPERENHYFVVDGWTRLDIIDGFESWRFALTWDNFEHWADESMLWELVKQRNSQRKHLSQEDIRADLDAYAITIRKRLNSEREQNEAATKQPQNHGPMIPNPPKEINGLQIARESVSEAAKQSGIGVNKLERAQSVLTHDPNLANQVENKEISLNAAYKQIHLQKSKTANPNRGRGNAEKNEPEAKSIDELTDNFCDRYNRIFGNLDKFKTSKTAYTRMFRFANSVRRAMERIGDATGWRTPADELAEAETFATKIEKLAPHAHPADIRKLRNTFQRAFTALDERYNELEKNGADIS